MQQDMHQRRSQDINKINVPSRRLLRRAGFTLAQGRLRSQGPVSPWDSHGHVPRPDNTKMYFPLPKSLRKHHNSEPPCLNLPATKKLKHFLLSAESSLDVGDLVSFSGNYNPQRLFHFLSVFGTNPLTSEFTRAVKTLLIASVDVAMRSLYDQESKSD